MPLQPGTPAPDFALTLTPGEAPLRLGDYKGEQPVVLLFFPLAFSSVCTTELDEVCRDYDRWSGLDAVVIGISIDSAFVNQRFAEELGALFPIASDFNKEAASDYGVLNDDYFGMRGVANRSAFVIDRRGVIAYTWMSEDPSILPPFDEIERAVIGAM
jgi:peroxiredoxin